MLKPSEIEGASLGIEKQFSDMEIRIMEDIVRRIRINGEITRSADWQIHRLHELGMSDALVREYIRDCLKYSDREMDELYHKVLRKGYYRDGAIYKRTGADMIPFEENEGLQQLISAVSDQTSGEMKNITQSLGFAVRERGRLQFLPVADYYQRTLDGALLDISSGAFDYNTVLKRVVREMTNSGLRTVDYASGRSIRIESAARMCVMTGFSQLTAKVNEDNAEQLGTKYFEVTWHGGARPEHQVWQGRVYTKEQLGTVCGLGAADGLCGCNCYHDYYPFFPGVSERVYTDEELDRMNREENTPVEYHGREYTKYQATQRQRSLERSMRAQRQTIHLLKEGGADEEDIVLARGKYRALSAEYTHFSKVMKLPQQRERVTVDGLRDIGKGKYKMPVKSTKTSGENSNSAGVAKSGNSGIIKINNYSDFSQIEKHLKDKYDIDLDSRVKALNFDACREVLSGVESMISEYPELIDNLQKVTVSNSGVMCCTGKEICFNPKYFTNSGELIKLCNDMSSSGYWVKNCTPASIGVHETAHAVEQLLIENNKAYTYAFEHTVAWNNCTEAKAVVKKAITDIKKTPYGKHRKKNELVKAISIYAGQNESETMAEAFADVFANGDNANPLSIRVKELTMYYYNKYKGGD